MKRLIKEDRMGRVHVSVNLRLAATFAAFISMLLLSPTARVGGAGDPEVVDALYISRAVFQGPKTNPIMGPDPSINLLSVPMPGHSQLGTLGQDVNVLNRYMRIYMPRNYEQLISERDLVVMFEAPLGIVEYPGVYFDRKWITWFVEAVLNEGMSLLMMGGDASWGGGYEGGNYYESWGETTLDRVLPFESFEGTNPSGAGPQLPEFAEGHPLSRLPWKEARYVELLNKVEPKQGATLVAEAVTRRVRYPWIATWKSGSGRTVGETQIFGSKGTSNFMLFEWDWYQDFVFYLAYLAAEKPIPDDVFRAHRLRGEINTHFEKNSLLISLFEFIEKFGASTLALYDDLEAINERAGEAKVHFRRDDYDTASDIFEEVHAAIDELNGKAIVAKERALTWVYIIEWFVVSGVALVTGAVVWNLLVRRRLYREIGTTRTF